MRVGERLDGRKHCALLSRLRRRPLDAGKARECTVANSEDDVVGAAIDYWRYRYARQGRKLLGNELARGVDVDLVTAVVHGCY